MAYSKGLPAWGAHLADELERIVALHDASTIAAVFIEPGIPHLYSLESSLYRTRSLTRLSLQSPGPPGCCRRRRDISRRSARYATSTESSWYLSYAHPRARTHL